MISNTYTILLVVKENIMKKFILPITMFFILAYAIITIFFLQGATSYIIASTTLFVILVLIALIDNHIKE